MIGTLNQWVHLLTGHFRPVLEVPDYVAHESQSSLLELAGQ